LNKFTLYFAAFLMLLIYSCRQSKESEHLNGKTDSIINSFSWADVKAPNQDSTFAYLNKLLQDKQLSPLSRFKLYNGICAYYYLGHKDYPKADLYADSMIMVIEKSDPEKYARELALGYFSKGDILFALGDYDESFKNYYRAKSVMSAQKDNCVSSDYSYRIGMVLYKQGKYADAGYFFSKGFEESISCKQDFSQIFRRQELLNNAALSYAKQNKLDSALLFYKKALSFIHQNDTLTERAVMFNIARGVVYGNMGGAYIKQKDFKKGEEFLIKSIAINIQPNHENNDAALTQVKLVRLYLQTTQLEKAAVALADLKLSTHKTRLAEATMNYHQLMAEYLARTGNKDEAFAHLLVFVKMQDSTQQQLNKLNATDINERFRNLESLNEIGYLKREREVQSFYLYIIAIFSVMTIAIILLIYFYWKKSKKNVAALTNLNNEVNLQRERLEDALTDLEKSDKEKDRILRAVAHDLRNPISGVVSLTTLMLEEDREEEDREKHQLIRDTCVGALNLINELIEAAENQSKEQLIAKRANIDLVSLVGNAIELLQFKAQEKKQIIQFNATITPVTVNVDGEKILRVVNNLISNAIKFSYEHTHILVEISITNENVMVLVKDKGIGIPVAIQENVFQTFTKAKRSGTQGERSYGLGLSISKQIINAHNGEIGFERGADEGTVFYFTLPLAK